MAVDKQPLAQSLLLTHIYYTLSILSISLISVTRAYNTGDRILLEHEWNSTNWPITPEK